MARITLKLPKKPAEPAAARKPTTTRARRARQLRHAGLQNQAAAEPQAPARQPPAPRAPAEKAPAKRRPRPDAGKASSARPPRPDAPKKKWRDDSGKPPGTEGRKPFRDESRKPRFDERKARPDVPQPRFDERKPVARAAPQRPPRPVTSENPGDPRLSKLMSELGLCSRREADEWIENGWVRVNGQVVKTLGTRVRRDVKIDVDPAAAQHQSEQVTILLNKPVGYVSGQPEDDHQPAMVLIKPENRWEEDPTPTKFRAGHLRGLAPAGRLDIDSTGLLVFTQDGRVAKRLIGQHSEVEKEYLVRVEGTLTDEGLEKLRHGLELDGVKLKPAKVSWANEGQLRFVLREGRKRQIRRMCEMVGLTVTGLKRVRSGGVPLGQLPVGKWRYLGRHEKF